MTDIWKSDVSPMSVLSLTAQWIDANYNLQRTVLQAQEFSGSHMAGAISMAFDKMLAAWKIPRTKIHAIIRDKTRNIAKSMQDSGLPRLPCVAHTLQLVVNEGVLSHRNVSDILAIR